MQTIRKYRWVVAGILLAAGFSFLSIAPLRAYAAETYGDGDKNYGKTTAADCSWNFNDDADQIHRTNCKGPYKNLTFAKSSGTRSFVQTSTIAECPQTFTRTTSNSQDGLLTGWYEYQWYANDDALSISGSDTDEGQNAVVFVRNTTDEEYSKTGFTGLYAGCYAFTEAAVWVNTPVDQTYNAHLSNTIKKKLSPLVEKTCRKANKDDASYDRCVSGYFQTIALCTTKGSDAVNSSKPASGFTGDYNPNTRFKEAFLKCLSPLLKSDTAFNRAAVSSAIGNTIFSDVIKDYSNEQNEWLNDHESTDETATDSDIDTCTASGNPGSWFLCPIYDGLGSLSDTILNKVLVPLLHTNPITTDPDDAIYQVWSAFRVWGDILLIIGVIVIVFGQAIGGGIVDAYTAKKVLPRLLLAAILINLSIYIVAFAVDVTNVIGTGIANIMTAPLDDVSLSPTGWKMGVFGGAGLVAAGVTSIVGLLAFAGALGGVGGSIAAFMPYLFLFVILPIVLAIIFVLIILILRQAIIMALVLVSPVAFALYCLPNTEQYFRKWWSLFFNMLLVFPIIMVIFAAANILAYTSLAANGTDSIWAYILALLLQFLPLFMIPYAFKLAGGVLGRIHDVASGMGKRGVEGLKGDVRDPWSRRNRAKRKASNKFLEGRENIVDRGNSLQGRTSDARFSRTGALLGRSMGWGAGMGNYEDLRSRRNKEASEMVQNHISTGGDSTVRALFARQVGDKWVGTNGTEYSASEVHKAQSLYGGDPSMFQAAYSYELGKASNDDELADTMNRGQAIMADRNIPGAKGVTLGAHWNHQQTRRELKHTKLQDNGKFIRGADGFTQEVAENVSGYALSNMRTSTIKALRQDYSEAKASKLYRQDTASTDASVVALREEATNRGVSVEQYLEKRQLDTDSKADRVTGFVTSTANSLNQRQLGGRGFALDADDHEVPVSGAQSGGPGLVSEQINMLVSEAATNNPPPQQPQQPRTP